MNKYALDRGRKKKLHFVLSELFPEYGSIKVYSSGIVRFKKSKWSLRRWSESLASLCLVEIPKRLSRYAQEKNDYQLRYLLEINAIQVVDFIYNLLLRSDTTKYHEYSTRLSGPEPVITVNMILRQGSSSHINPGNRLKETLQGLKLEHFYFKSKEDKTLL